MKAVNAAGRKWSDDSAKGVQLNEWTKEGWTYHAKGNHSIIFSQFININSVLFLFLRRYMALPYTEFGTHPDSLRLYESKFTIFTLRH
jgi:hypothetical protein